jgi:NADH dehydrogenase FAD-containing subunit
MFAGRPVDEYNRLLHVVIVGGGPTGVEVAGELSNLINRDLHRIYPDRAKAMRWVEGAKCEPWVLRQHRNRKCATITCR